MLRDLRRDDRAPQSHRPSQHRKSVTAALSISLLPWFTHVSTILLSCNTNPICCTSIAKGLCPDPNFCLHLLQKFCPVSSIKLTASMRPRLFPTSFRLSNPHPHIIYIHIYMKEYLSTLTHSWAFLKAATRNYMTLSHFMCQDLKYESRLLNEVGSTGGQLRSPKATNPLPGERPPPAPPSPQFKVGGKGTYVKLRDCPCKPKSLSGCMVFDTSPYWTSNAKRVGWNTTVLIQTDFSVGNGEPQKSISFYTTVK